MSIPPTLLLADDSVTIQRVVALTFADQPVRLVVAKDGQDAINRMATERPDVVLVDTNMPCVDGYEVAKWVRQQPHLSAVPVLLLAGATDPVDEQRLHDSGANGVLEKPFEPTHVISRVKELLGMKGATPAAPTGRLLTPPDVTAVKRPAPQAVPDAPAPPLAAAPPPAAAMASPSAVVQPTTGGPDEAPGADVPIDEVFAAYEARAAALEPGPGGPASASTESPARGRPDALAAPAGDTRDRFAVSEGRVGGEAGATGVGFYTGPESAASADRRHSTPAPAPLPAVVATPAAGAPADVFASLLAAELGDPAAVEEQRRTALQVNDETMEMLAGKIVERLQPGAIRDELQRALGSSLRETVIDTVRDSVATETRAAVAEAVQAAVDGSLVGTVRGALNEAVNVAVPPAVASAVSQSVGARMDIAVQETVRRALPAAVENAVQEFVLSRVTVLVRDTVEQELRASIGPLIQETVRDVVRETSERLVREEIARIRQKHAS